MQNGKSDIMENVPAKAFDTLKAAGADIETVDGFNQAFIMFNTKQKPFATSACVRPCSMRSTPRA